jgi:hypothetical protein
MLQDCIGDPGAQQQGGFEDAIFSVLLFRYREASQADAGQILNLKNVYQVCGESVTKTVGRNCPKSALRHRPRLYLPDYAASPVLSPIPIDEAGDVASTVSIFHQWMPLKSFARRRLLIYV